MPKETRVLFLDGIQYPSTVDKWLSSAEYITLAPGNVPKDKVLGFSSRNLFLDWARSQGVHQGIQEVLDKGEKASQEWGRLTENEKNNRLNEQVAAYKKKQTGIIAKLKQKGINPSDIEKLKELHDRGEIGTLLLFTETNYKGSSKYFLPGYYANLNWVGFNDKAKSAYNFNLYWCELWQNSWCRGKKFLIAPLEHVPDFGWFGGRASSVLC